MIILPFLAGTEAARRQRRFGCFRDRSVVLERFVGRMLGRSGGVVRQRKNVFEGGQAKESYFVIPGSATGELEGLQGGADLVNRNEA
jgi:hypothetical protein